MISMENRGRVMAALNWMVRVVEVLVFPLSR